MSIKPFPLLPLPARPTYLVNSPNYYSMHVCWQQCQRTASSSRLGEGGWRAGRVGGGRNGVVVSSPLAAGRGGRGEHAGWVGDGWSGATMSSSLAACRGQVGRRQGRRTWVRVEALKKSLISFGPRDMAGWTRAMSVRGQ